MAFARRTRVVAAALATLLTAALFLAARPTEAAAEAAVDALAAESLARALFAQGMGASAVARELKRRLGLARNEAYRLAQEAAPAD